VPWSRWTPWAACTMAAWWCAASPLPRPPPRAGSDAPADPGTHRDTVSRGLALYPACSRACTAGVCAVTRDRQESCYMTVPDLGRESSAAVLPRQLHRRSPAGGRWPADVDLHMSMPGGTAVWLDVSGSIQHTRLAALCTFHAQAADATVHLHWTRCFDRRDVDSARWGGS